jgi:hypothetical protein
MAGRGGSRTSAGWHQGRGAWREEGKGAGDGRSGGFQMQGKREGARDEEVKEEQKQAGTGGGRWRDGRSDFKWGLGEKIPASVAAAADLAHASAWRWASVLSGEDQGVFPRTAHRNRLKHSL